MSSSGQIVLITGANKGLGRHIAEVFLARPNVTLIAGVRDLYSTKELEATAQCGANSKLISVKIDSVSETDAAEAVHTLKSEYGIRELDVVIANAGYGTVYGTTIQAKPQDLRDTVEVNAIGPLTLFQAVRELLLASSNPRFVLSGSPIGSIAGMEKQPYPMLAYGASKAMANYITRKIHVEHEALTAFVIDPGFMKTDTGNAGARYLGLSEAFIDPRDSAEFAVKQIDHANRTDTSGKFISIGTSPPGGLFEW